MSERDDQSLFKPMECPTHGHYQSRNYFGGRWTSCPECTAREDAASAEKADEANRARLDAAFDEKLKQSGVPLRFKRCTLANFILSVNESEREMQQTVLDSARRYIDNFSKNLEGNMQDMLFAGKVGTGKTHIACAIAIELIKRGFTVRYETLGDYFRRIRDTYKQSCPRSELDVRDEFAAYDLLILDEVGVQAGSEAEELMMFSLLNKRYGDARPTLFLSNFDKAALITILGERLVSRIKEGSADLFYFSWGDHRSI